MEKLPIVLDLVKIVTTAAPDQFANAQTAAAEFMEYDQLRRMNAQDMVGGQEQRWNELRKKVIRMMSLDVVTAQKLSNQGYQAELNEM